jgi:hypothetical protein
MRRSTALAILILLLTALAAKDRNAPAQMIHKVKAVALESSAEVPPDRASYDL